MDKLNRNKTDYDPLEKEFVSEASGIFLFLPSKKKINSMALRTLWGIMSLLDPSSPCHTFKDWPLFIS
jgi:hypothetical protein